MVQAITRLRTAYLNWRRTTIYAPETGVIAKRPVEVGQQITPNNILMIIVPLNQLWVDANFKESQLINMRVGQPVEMESDVYGSSFTYHGQVEGINPGTGSAFDLLPPQNATGNWIKIVQRLPVRIVIDSKELAKHPLRMGLSMTVTVNTHNRKGKLLGTVAHPGAIYETSNYNNQLKEVDALIKQILEANGTNISYPASNDNASH